MNQGGNSNGKPERTGESGPGKDGQKPHGGPPPANAAPSRGLFGLILAMLIVITMMVLYSSMSRVKDVSVAEFRTLWQNDQIVDKRVEIRDDAVYAERAADASSKSPTPIKIAIPLRGGEEIIKEVQSITQGQAVTRTAPTWLPILLYWILPFLFIFGLFWLLSRGLRGAGGPGGMLGNFGKSRHRTLTKEMTNVTFADVAGIDEAKDEVSEIIEFLKNPKRFTRLGGRVPRGVLLVGEPGCGKTLLAKAIAGEADVPFFSISGSDFVEMFVGVGASRVRDLFKQAKESAPCIIFLDEIDAVGRRRGGGFTTGGHDEREQTLNAILVEMDGFATGDGVIVIAATNRSDILDPALVRPGRFDRQIVVPLPDIKGRLEILRVHAKKVKLGPNADLERIAKGTPMFSGADLAAIINEAAISATLQNKDWIEQEDLEEARDKVKFGRARTSRKRDKDETRATAFHEAGHAVLQCLLTDADPLHKVTIIPRGQALGATFSLPEKDRVGYGFRWLSATMRVLCGGRIAEQRATGDIASGAAMDISQVTRLARAMILDWGMSPRLGFVRYAGEDSRETFIPEKGYSEETARIVDEEIKRMVDEAYRDAEKLLDANWSKVEAVADALLRYETLSADEVSKVMRGEGLAKPTISDLLNAEAKKRRDEVVGGLLSPPETAPGTRPEPPPGSLPTPA